MHELKVDDPSIPAALRKVYAAFGDPSAPSCVIAGQDSLLPPTQLRRTGEFVVFLHENQGCWSGAYREEGDMDPEVYLFEYGKEPVKISATLEQFLVTFLLSESAVSAPMGVTQEDGILPSEALKLPVEPLWLNAKYSMPEPTHSFYWCEEGRILIMRWDGDYAPWLWMGSYEDRWEEVLNSCPGGYVIGAGPNRDRTILSTTPPPPAPQSLWSRITAWIARF